MRGMTTVRAKRRSAPVQTALEGVVLPAYRGLARRLADGSLRQVEQAAFERAVAVLRLREQGLPLHAIAQELHTTENALKKFVARGVFRTIAQFLRERESATAEQRQRMTQRHEREHWDDLATSALDYYAEAFRRRDDGEYVDGDRAERAAKLIAEGQGWTEPEPPPSRPVPLSAGIIQAQMRVIAVCDAANGHGNSQQAIAVSRGGSSGGS